MTCIKLSLVAYCLENIASGDQVIYRKEYPSVQQDAHQRPTTGKKKEYLRPMRLLQFSVGTIRLGIKGTQLLGLGSPSVHGKSM